MAWYSSAGYKFWLALSIEYFLILAGMIWHNNWMVFGGMLLGVAMLPWVVHLTIVDNKSGGKQ